MTAPATAEPGGLGEATGESVGMVLESITGALGSTVRVVSVPLLLAATVVVLVVVLVAARRVAREIRDARAQDDPRDRVDPLASDVLGEWP